MSDLIKRSDAIKVLKDSVVEMGGDDFCEMGVHIDDIEAVVNAIPSADRPSKEGEWEIVALGWHSIRRCSNCKWTQAYSDPKYLGYRYNFCPNCGCRMKGADDEAD